MANGLEIYLKVRKVILARVLVKVEEEEVRVLNDSSLQFCVLLAQYILRVNLEIANSTQCYFRLSFYESSIEKKIKLLKHQMLPNKLYLQSKHKSSILMKIDSVPKVYITYKSHSNRYYGKYYRIRFLYA